MKKRLLKTLALAVVGSLCAVGAANADPILDAGISMTGTFAHVNAANISVGIAAATGIDSGGAFPGAADNTFGVDTAGGCFSSLVSGFTQSLGTIENFQFDVFAPTPRKALWPLGGFSFEKSSLPWDKGSSGSKNDLYIYGFGMMSGPGYDNKPCVWNFTGLGARDTNFPGSAFAVASSVPEPASMLLFGTGLVGLAGVRLRKKRK